jgi:hypothetical protein
LRRRSILAAVPACGAAGLATGPALPADLCVRVSQPRCFSTIQAAIDAAHDGDSIHVGPGTFAGGITIDKDVAMVGVSATATVIQGGGPVVTIGDGTSGLTVSIRGVTITGGLNSSKPESSVGRGFFAAGGGVLIPEAAGHGTGARVTVTDSVISGNRVTAGVPQPVCDDWPCSFASGGGVANWGTLTVTNTRIVDNVAGSTATSRGLATDARGGGIWNSNVGAVTLRHSWVIGNRSAVSTPNGRFAEGGGIGDDGTIAIHDAVVSGNTADAQTAAPSTVPIDIATEAVGGGIRITDAAGARATITGTTIIGNKVNATNAGGDASATSGGLDADGTVALVSSTVDHNTVHASVGSSGNLAAALFGGLEIGVTGVVTIRNSSVSGNALTAESLKGAANVAGAGIGNRSGLLTIARTRVTGNRGVADGVGGLALGGGLLNVDFGGGPPELTLSDSVVTANQLTAPPGVTPRGGGIFSADLVSTAQIPFTRTHTVIAGNKPDQCVGC